MDKPMCSLDLNEIKHLWDTVERQVWAPNPFVNLLADLRNAMQEVCNLISQEDIYAFINSMPTQMAVIIQARGNNTRCYITFVFFNFLKFV